MTIIPQSSGSSTNLGSSPTGEGIQPSFSSPLPSVSSMGTLTQVEKSEIAKNNALKLLYRWFMVIGTICMAFVTGGLLVWLFTTSNSISSDLGYMKSSISNIDTTIAQLRDDKNRDIDRLQKEIDSIHK